ncbi:MAG: NAD(P)H-hydrate dehydratase [Bacteroidales bacterium]|nr:NAD(P)H-hydrate dehydratase [Bacteroidales bacterium]
MMTPDFLYSRNPDSYKNCYGHALLIAGSYGMMGAAVLAAKSCLRAGVGLLTVHVPRCGVSIMQAAVPEAMVSVDSDERRITSLPEELDCYDAVAVGPGIGTDEATQHALLALLERRAAECCRPLVLDADALNILAAHPDRLHQAAGAIITPHAMEYTRLFGDADAQAMANLHELTIVRKAHNTTIFAPGSAPVENHTGNAGMATGGSGDVLTGIMLGLVAQNGAYAAHYGTNPCSLQQVADLAVHLHGLAGDIATDAVGQPSLIASDIIASLPEAIKRNAQ